MGGDSGSLIVTDDEGNNPVGLLFAGSSSHTIANLIDVVLARFKVTVDDGSGGGDINHLPVADFTYIVSDLTATFTDDSSDNDGTVVSWLWDFGDGSISNEQEPVHTYAADDTYTVSLTVTDNDGATGSTSKGVTVHAPVTGDIELFVYGYTERGWQKADLQWSGATSKNVDIFRNSTLIVITKNDGVHTDRIGRDIAGSYTYQICEEGTDSCSNEATVAFP